MTAGTSWQRTEAINDIERSTESPLHTETFNAHLLQTLNHLSILNAYSTLNKCRLSHSFTAFKIYLEQIESRGFVQD
jgi:hypothetical protein